MTVPWKELLTLKLFFIFLYTSLPSRKKDDEEERTFWGGKATKEFGAEISDNVRGLKRTFTRLSIVLFELKKNHMLIFPRATKIFSVIIPVECHRNMKLDYMKLDRRSRQSAGNLLEVLNLKEISPWEFAWIKNEDCERRLIVVVSQI